MEVYPATLSAPLSETESRAKEQMLQMGGFAPLLSHSGSGRKHSGEAEPSVPSLIQGSTQLGEGAEGYAAVVQEGRATAPCFFPKLGTVLLTGKGCGLCPNAPSPPHLETHGKMRKQVWGRRGESFPAPPRNRGRERLPSPDWNHSGLRKAQERREDGAGAD